MAGNTNDGTTLGTAEVISDEYIDPSAQVVRRDPLLPPTAYKLPRSKIAVGPYGQDQGDASEMLPLYVREQSLLRIAELERLRDREEGMALMQRYAQETVSLADSRGAHLTTRGQR